VKIARIVLWAIVMLLGSIVCYLAQIGGTRFTDWVGTMVARVANKLVTKELPVVR